MTRTNENLCEPSISVSYLPELLHMLATAAGKKVWSNIMEILDEKDGVDTELLVYAMTLINKVRWLLFTPLLLYVTLYLLFKSFRLKSTDKLLSPTFFCLILIL